MKNIKIKAGLVLLAMSGLTQAEVTWVNPLQSHELEDFTSNKSMNMINTSQEPVKFNQSLLGHEKITTSNDGFQAMSRQYWLDVDGQELTKGVQLPLTSSLAIVRISRSNTTAQKNHAPATIDQTQIEMMMAGQMIEPEVFVNANQLKAAGMQVSDSTVGFKVRANAGELILKLSGLNKVNDNYVIHVFEPESEHVLSLVTNKQQYAAGADVVIKAELQHQNDKLPMRVNGYISAPNGEKHSDLKFQMTQKGDYQAVIPAIKGQSLADGLWEVHTITESDINGQKVLRDASTAFAVSMASAQFSGDLLLSERNLSIGVTNALPARYEISGLLYGMNESGIKQPVALMMSAKWLEVGQSQIDFDLPLDLIHQSGLKAPFVVEQLTLKNQSVLTPVQKVSSGLVISELIDENVSNMK